MSDYRHSGCTDSKLEGVIRDMATAYREVFGGRIEQILLYGSYARGDADGDSDIDIAAIVHGDRQELQEKLKKVWDVSSSLLKLGSGIAYHHHASESERNQYFNEKGMVEHKRTWCFHTCFSHLNTHVR